MIKRWLRDALLRLFGGTQEPPLPAPPPLQYPPGDYMVEGQQGGWSYAKIRYCPPSLEPEVYVISHYGNLGRGPMKVGDFLHISPCAKMGDPRFPLREWTTSEDVACCLCYQYGGGHGENCPFGPKVVN